LTILAVSIGRGICQCRPGLGGYAVRHQSGDDAAIALIDDIHSAASQTSASVPPNAAPIFAAKTDPYGRDKKRHCAGRLAASICRPRLSCRVAAWDCWVFCFSDDIITPMLLTIAVFRF